MNIDKKEVKYVAALARLRIDEGEEERWSEHMEAIIGFADKLNELDLEEADNSESKTASIFNVFREDIREESYPRDVMLENAPRKYDGCYVVPKIVE